jgi:hypothetical protein
MRLALHVHREATLNGYCELDAQSMMSLCCVGAVVD